MLTEVEYVQARDLTATTTETQSLYDGTMTEIVSITGLGIPKPIWRTTAGVSTIGEKVDHMTLGPRNINMRLLWKTSSASAAVTRRDLINSTFSPYSPEWLYNYTSDPILDIPRTPTLKFTRADSSVRSIDVIVDDVVDLPHIGDSDFGEHAGLVDVKFKAPYPLFYDPTAIDSGTFGFTTTATVTPSIEDAQWFMYPVIELTGPYTTCLIEVYTGAEPDFCSLNIGAITSGDVITIDTRPFKKAVYDDDGDPDYSFLTYPDQLGLFYIPHEAVVGATTITIKFTATGADGNTRGRLYYNKVYTGI